MKFSCPKCVLFDLDGTLVDSAPDLGFAANAVRGDLAMPPLEMDRYRPFASGGARALLKVALDIDDNHPDFAKHRNRFLEVYRNNLSRDSRLFPGVELLLESLGLRDISWGVVTNKPDYLTQPLMQQFGLSMRTGCVIGAQDGLKPKPAPDMLLRACSQLRLSPAQCIYVGDDRRDIQAGISARMETVAAAWGYIGSGESIDDWNASAVIQDPRELPDLWL